MLLYPLVAAGSVAFYVRETDADVGRLNVGYTVAYAAGTITLLLIHYV
jgi:hypothetical protein